MGFGGEIKLLGECYFRFTVENINGVLAAMPFMERRAGLIAKNLKLLHTKQWR